MSESEWMTSTQAKDRFGLTFKLLRQMSAKGKVRSRHIYSDVVGEDVYIFNVQDVRDYIESAEEG